MYKQKWAVAAALIAFAVSIPLAGCGGDDGGNDGDASTKATATNAEQPKGEPIKILSTTPVESKLASLPQFNDVASVYAKMINASGGIGGRPLEIIQCDNKGEVNETTECARKAVEGKAVAMTGFALAGADRLLAVLKPGQIPWMPAASANLIEYQNDNSFPTSIGSFQGAARAMVAYKFGCKTPAILALKLPQLAPQVESINKVLKQRGVTTKVVQYPPTATDLTPYVSQLKDADCIIDGGNTEGATAQIAAGIRSAQVKAKRFVTDSTLYPTLKTTADVWNDRTTIVSAFTTPQATGPWASYTKALDSYATLDRKKTDYDSGGPATWVAMTVIGAALQELVKSGKPIDATTLGALLRSGTPLETGGITPPFDFSKESALPEYPRLFNTTVGVAEVKDGKGVPDPEYHDVGSAIEGKVGSDDPYFTPGG